MAEHELFCNSIYEEQAQLAERELSSFIAAVTELYGPEQARLSEKDWLDESEVTGTPSLSTESQWRAVTIAASVRLADRLSAIADHARAPWRVLTRLAIRYQKIDQAKEIQSDEAV
jgi:hypothetical protein